MTVVWGIVGMLVGVIIAAELIWPGLAVNLPWFSFGRLRPLHTNAVIFAFAGKLAAFTLWGWQAIIVAAAITLPLGMTSGKEYAKFEWPIDIAIAIVWVAYGIVFFGTLVKRRVSHICVANWFFAAFIITVAVLHIVNNAAMPEEPLPPTVVAPAQRNELASERGYGAAQSGGKDLSRSQVAWNFAISSAVGCRPSDATNTP